MIGMLIYLAVLIPIMILYIYILVLMIKCLRRGILALDKYLAKDSPNDHMTL